MKFTTADVSLSKDVFDKAVKSALGRVNTHGISNLTQHQLKALLNFLCGKDSFVCLPTGHGKSLIIPTGTKDHNRGKILLLV